MDMTGDMIDNALAALRRIAWFTSQYHDDMTTDELAALDSAQASLRAFIKRWNG